MEYEEINSYLEIEGIKANSIAGEVDLNPGDKLVKINGQVLNDYVDYKFLVADNYLELEVIKSSGQYWMIEVEKNYDEKLGIEFSDIVFDGLKTCQNKCVFCFVDQMPTGYRRTLNLKDDDYRFSFLKGSYITLTNLSEREINRIKRMHLSPLNISVHSTNPKIRKKMLNNKNAGDILEKVAELTDAGIELNTQIVLCPGLNDGKYLDETITDLAQFIPQIKSLAIVPVGLTKFREGLFDLKSFTARGAIEVIQQVESYQEQFRRENNNNFVYLADEFYLLADEELPEQNYYDDFPQLENGVGQVRLFRDQFLALKEDLPTKLAEPLKVTLITAKLGAQALDPIIDELLRIKNLEVEPFVIENHFFGPEVTVTGLLTGTDILDQLQEAETELGDLVIVPEVVLNDNDLFLDDLSWTEFKSKLNVEVIKVGTDVEDFIENLLGKREVI
jgi:putative radical SAM enzyme (TIGR03279 family)